MTIVVAIKRPSLAVLATDRLWHGFSVDGQFLQGTHVKIVLHLWRTIGTLRLREEKTMLDLLRGRWLGHPLHPVLVHFPAAMWPLALILDLISLFECATCRLY